MKPYSYKRILAYILDVIIITIISEFITMIVPQSETYQAKSEEYIQLLKDYSQQKISKDEYLEQVNESLYILNKESVSVTIITIALSIGYFAISAYYMKGQTVGKKLMHIKIVSDDEREPSLKQYLIRSLFMNSILSNILGVIALLALQKTLYLKVNDVIVYFFISFSIVDVSMILFRKDRRGLHDLIAKTSVINTNEKE